MSHNPSAPIANASSEVLRHLFLAQHRAFVQTPAYADAASALSLHLLAVLQKIEPQCLGIYWALPGEFNPLVACLQAPFMQTLPMALPFATKASHANPAQMHYRGWDRHPPQTVDECRIPTGNGPKVQPDVVLVPCVAFTAHGYRLGYGGGYFDRYLQAHQGVTSIGLAWGHAKLSPAAWQPQAHDVALTLVLTQTGVVAES